MPLGDAQRTWFPEMIARLRSEWRAGLSMPALLGLRDELDETLHLIRASRNFRTPIVTCPRCGMAGPGAEPHVSVRALILALARFGSRRRSEPVHWKGSGHNTESKSSWTLEGKVQESFRETCQH